MTVMTRTLLNAVALTIFAGPAHAAGKVGINVTDFGFGNRTVPFDGEGMVDAAAALIATP